MSKVWPQDVIRELLARAEASGEARATLTNAREAELFRFAIYNFRKHNDIGENLLVTLDGDNVVVTKKEPVTVTIN